MVTPSLTTVAQYIYQMGALASRMLIKQIEGIELTEQNVLVKARLIKRGTTRSVER